MGVMVDYRELTRLAEKQIELAEDSTVGNPSLYVIPAVILSWIAIEAFMNNMLDDFADLPKDVFSASRSSFYERTAH